MRFRECDQVYRIFHVIHNRKEISYIIKLISFPPEYIFAMLLFVIVKPPKKIAMEKIILLGIAVWFSYVLSDGFPPKPVRKPFNQEKEILKKSTCKPETLKCKWIKTHHE